MNVFLFILPMLGVVLIFAAAAWAGPKVIRSIYPEDKHEAMISLHRRMVMIAIVIGILGFFSGILPFLANNPS